MLDLDQNILTELQDILAKHIPNINVFVYGSRVKGRSYPGSDLDLVLIAPYEKPIEKSTLYELRNALEESNIPILVDFLDWAQMPESFKSEIKGTMRPLVSTH